MCPFVVEKNKENNGVNGHTKIDCDSKQEEETKIAYTNKKIEIEIFTKDINEINNNTGNQIDYSEYEKVYNDTEQII